MKIVFLDARTLGESSDYTALKNLGELILYDMTKAEQVAERIADADVVITNKVSINAGNAAQAANLKLVCVAATGYNMLDTAYLKERGIAVTNVAGYSTAGVVQHTFAMLFYLLHSLRSYDDFVRDGHYAAHDMFTCLEWPFEELAGKRWGIIGLGTIGRRVAHIANAIGCEALYYSASGNTYDVPWERVELDELLTTCDVITIHAPLNAAPQDLIGEQQLKMMKRTAYLINSGRGGIVNEAALARAIDDEMIAAAATDVLTTEPIALGSPLLQVKNKNRLLITPHIAWASAQSRVRLLREIVENIMAYDRGEKRNRIV